jgi:hypothetical protein
MAAACVLIVTYPWFSLARPDSLMLLLLTTSIALGIRLSRCTRDAPALTIGFVGICVLAACAKQNGIVAMVPMLLFLAIEKRWRSLRVSLLLLGVLLALAPVAATALLGHFWKANIVDGLRGGIDFSGTVAKTYGPFFLMFAAFSAAAIATAWQWVIEPHEAELRYVGLCAPVFLAEAMVSGLKFGSAVNYFDEFVIVAAIVLAVSGDRFLCCFNATMLRRAIALFALIFLPMYTFRQVQSYVLGNMNPTHHSLRTLPSAQYGAFSDVGSYLQQHLNNGSYFVSYIQPLCLQLPRQCIVPDPLNVHLASRMRAVDYAALEKLSREHRIQYMILPESVMIEEAFRYQSLPGFDPRTLQLETQVGGAKIYSIRKIGTM